MVLICLFIFIIVDQSKRANDKALIKHSETFEKAAVLGLRNFYRKTNGKNWIVSTGWNDENDLNPCNWYGIKCQDNALNGNGVSNIKSINLSSNNLTANMFECSDLIKLNTLQELDISSNKLNGDMTILTESLLQLPSLSVIDMRFNLGLIGSVSNEVCKYDQGHIFKLDCHVKCACCDQLEYCRCFDYPNFVDINGNDCKW